jgi:hypothetical protein
MTMGKMETQRGKSQVNVIAGEENSQKTEILHYSLERVYVHLSQA